MINTSIPCKASRGGAVRGAVRRLAVAVVAIALTTAGSVAISGAPAAADSGGWVYTTPGKHTVNGRQWKTSCEKYSSAVYRCRAEIWATQVRVASSGSGYESVQGWAFNNLTYLPSSRGTWQGNPLATTGTFVSDGRKWRTSCGDEWTGPNGCRSFIWTDVIESDLDPSGNRRYAHTSKWVFNNIVTFGTTTKPPLVASPQSCTITIDGIPVKVTALQETATVVKTSGTRATVTMVEREIGTACGVHTVFRDTTGRIGYGGVTPAATRRQNTGTTPAGVFTIKDAFGIRADPGTALAWRDVGANSYWVLDNDSPHYNQWREGGLGGFNKQESERLISYPGQYDYVSVIDYNRSPAVKGKGGAIFLHVHGKGATAGCVSISEANMKTHLRTVTPGDTIVIR